MTSYVLLLLLLALLYGLFLMRLKQGFKALTLQPTTSAQPKITVIVCAHNEEHHLPQSIAHLIRQEYPKDKTEIIYVNDRSSDGSGRLLEQAASDHDFIHVITVSERLSGFAPKKRAIDLAIRQASGEIVLLTDADGRPGKEWISSMVSYFTDDIDMVIGYAPYSVIPEGHRTKRMLALEYLSHAAVAAATAGLGYPVTCVGTNMAYRKQLYHDIGGFGRFKSFISGDDDLFLTLVRESGRHRVTYATCAQSHVYNNPPRLWSKFLHQRMRYASKGFNYTRSVTAGLLAFYLLNVLLLSGVIWSFWRPAWAPWIAAAFLLKGLFEFIFMKKAADTLNDRRNLGMFPAAFLLHIPYIIVFGFLGQFNYFRWAEETAEFGVPSGTAAQAGDL